ncbi:MAG: hypothetical protein HY902_06740 [Deltaproteobacteria bacterium]|nr:hypothetical protein [Deltaproteobacteria bacterium]
MSWPASHVCGWAWLALLAAAGTPACKTALAPLDQPLPAATRVTGGLQMVAAAADSPQLGETIRLVAGQHVNIATAPQPIDGADATLSAFTTSLHVESAKAEWLDSGQLRVVAVVTPQDLPLTALAAKSPTCGMTCKTSGVTVTAVAQLSRSGATVAAVLSQAPTVEFKQLTLQAPDGCLEALGPAVPKAAETAVRAALAAPLAARFGTTLVQALQTIVPPGLAVQGQYDLATDPPTPQWLRLHSSFAPDGQPLIQRQLGFAAAPLDVALTVDRASCAADVPAPPIAEAELQPGEAPQTPTVIRRAMVVSAPMIARLAWAWLRSGQWCRAGGGGLPLLEQAAWPSSVVPELQPWLESSPTGAQFWPHSGIEVAVVDRAQGPVVAWTLDDATLEIRGHVAGTEAVVLTVRGTFHGELRPLVTPSGKLALVQQGVTLDSAVVASPLLGEETVTGSNQGLGRLIDAALTGIFDPPVVLPLDGWLPPGTVVTGVRRGGGSLWLWLDGGLSSP